MTSLKELYDRGGESKHFAEEFTNKAHAGDWSRSRDHWTRVVRHIADHVAEFDELSAEQALHRAEQLAQAQCLMLAQVGRCWACATP
ncbi:DUF6313 family protein [Streptomyces sp. NPDC016845]|uniref:DUF6313 family protein n=1 Tax=Streptomyces sp. NPDC016845 TaxID=3364972 RepID=UPI003790F001